MSTFVFEDLRLAFVQDVLSSWIKDIVIIIIVCYYLLSVREVKR